MPEIVTYYPPELDVGERRQRDRQERWKRMSPHEKAEHQRAMRLCIGGLIARDVQ